MKTTLFYRAILEDLETWKSSKLRKPLVLRGARQVGKTTVIKQFGQSFDSCVWLSSYDYCQAAFDFHPSNFKP
jgi:hypothetical protein